MERPLEWSGIWSGTERTGRGMLQLQLQLQMRLQLQLQLRLQLQLQHQLHPQMHLTNGTERIFLNGQLTDRSGPGLFGKGQCLEQTGRERNIPGVYKSFMYQMHKAS